MPWRWRQYGEGAAGAKVLRCGTGEGGMRRTGVMAACSRRGTWAPAACRLLVLLKFNVVFRAIAVYCF